MLTSWMKTIRRDLEVELADNVLFEGFEVKTKDENYIPPPSPTLQCAASPNENQFLGCVIRMRSCNVYVTPYCCEVSTAGRAGISRDNDGKLSPNNAPRHCAT
ncbi:hypothetical protein WA026_003943 [Henosepilachna vigintioctopunctata]|uniref:Uncharacterized protein n=1 Tax=Henosepilachna vigintioctopunctata TaxID=420089 RepID=A0AAW1UD94_9CUCU